MKPSVLVVGGDGLIGRALTTHLLERGETTVATVLAEANVPHAIHFNLLDDPWPALPQARAAVICAAVTSQEQCRHDPVGTRHINVARTLKLIGELLAADTFVLFLSTNLVFDGSKLRCKPDDPQSPRTEYGRQKAEVERALAQWPGQTAIVRLTKVFHSELPLLQKWRQDLSAGRQVDAFSDYVCAPIHLAAVAAGIGRIALEMRPGIWHFSGPTDVSYGELARTAARAIRADAGLIQSVPAPPGLLEHLPVHTTLDPSRAAAELGLVFPGADEVVAECLSEA